MTDSIEKHWLYTKWSRSLIVLNVYRVNTWLLNWRLWINAWKVGWNEILSGSGILGIFFIIISFIGINRRAVMKTKLFRLNSDNDVNELFLFGLKYIHLNILMKNLDKYLNHARILIFSQSPNILWFVIWCEDEIMWKMVFISFVITNIYPDRLKW